MAASSVKHKPSAHTLEGTCFILAVSFCYPALPRFLLGIQEKKEAAG